MLKNITCETQSKAFYNEVEAFESRNGEFRYLSETVDLLDRLYGPKTFPNHIAIAFTNTMFRTSGFVVAGKC